MISPEIKRIRDRYGQIRLNRIRELEDELGDKIADLEEIYRREPEILDRKIRKVHYDYTLKLNESLINLDIERDLEEWTVSKKRIRLPFWIVVSLVLLIAWVAIYLLLMRLG